MRDEGKRVGMEDARDRERGSRRKEGRRGKNMKRGSDGERKLEHSLTFLRDNGDLMHSSGDLITGH